jgi:hypothetical protein
VLLPGAASPLLSESFTSSILLAGAIRKYVSGEEEHPHKKVLLPCSLVVELLQELCSFNALLKRHLSAGLNAFSRSPIAAQTCINPQISEACAPMDEAEP